MKKISRIEEKYKDRLILSIFERLNNIDHFKWEEIARENDMLAETINAIMSDISNLSRGNIASHLRDKLPSYKKHQNLFNRS